MTAREEAAARRAEGTAQRADRPRQRRADESPESSPHPAVLLSSPATLRGAGDGDVAGYNFRGVASVTERGYTVWDMFGEYTEVIAADAFDHTLNRSDLDVPLVIGHDQDKRLARTTNGTLRLSMSDAGLAVDADLDPADKHVQEIVPKLRSGLVNEMSFAFRIEAGTWSEDYTEYRVERVEIHRGDVAIVGYGANPYTGEHTTLTETPARSDTEAEDEARDELPAADAPADEPATELTTTPERSAAMSDATPEVLAAEVVEPTPTPEVREDPRIEELEHRVADLLEQQEIRHNAEEAQKRMNTPAYDQVARVGAEERTYRPDQDPKGGQFVRDVITAQMGDYAASERLSRHMSEERVERGGQLTRAAATTAFAGLVVPQYLTDLVAPAAKAGRPFADAIRRLPLPAEGMTVNISKITTATTTALQTQGTSVSETDIDDTLLSPAVQTIAGSQTVTRQAVERGTGALDVVLEDLGRAYSTTLDSTLLNQATNGLTNVATGITYTDTSATAAELYPKILQGIASVEAALLDQDPGDTIAVMHSRRWYWLQSQLSSTFPLIGQGYNQNVIGEANPASRYGSGFRGFLPSGTAVVVDNNIVTTDGAATNQDEIYFVSAANCFLWEDAGAPMMIRTDTGPSVKSLGVDVVVYGYAAYTHVRRAHAYKISGSGLTAPTW